MFVSSVSCPSIFQMSKEHKNCFRAQAGKTSDLLIWWSVPKISACPKAARQIPEVLESWGKGKLQHFTNRRREQLSEEHSCSRELTTKAVRDLEMGFTVNSCSSPSSIRLPISLHNRELRRLYKNCQPSSTYRRHQREMKTDFTRTCSYRIKGNGFKLKEVRYRLEEILYCDGDEALE